ncbi:NAD(P)/FAD-dependent oxidoreductase [Bacillus sp. FJAT-47783]|uniref:NAD(P)/FAD-dependent oxidoreductase n=1 Tax=Bacillus sp. FJAT-47783 TaxID=2922712 RepID=UPI001FABB6A8|nr:NAD(P)/FAD-dependent oxidoreductase [Bacillus sp. FJAT-47783]
MADVIVIGAGPAGLSGAIAAKEWGLNVIVLDEFMKPGGRLLGQLHQEPDGTWWNGIKEADKLYQKAEQLGVEVKLGVSVHHLSKEEQWTVHTNQGNFQAANVLVATGAAEYAVPIRGWTLPGVMSIGAAQVMTNVHRVKVGERGIIIGANILSFAIMNELKLAGIDIECMLLPEKSKMTKQAGDPLEVMKSLIRASHLAPSALLRWGSRFMVHDQLRKLALKWFPKNGYNIWGIPVHLRKAAVEIVGEGKVEGVKVTDITIEGEKVARSEKIIPVDFVCIAGGLYPLAELAAVARCPFHFCPELGGHIPKHNEQMQTPLEGLYVAGNITGIESAKVAMAQGTVAGYSIAENMGVSSLVEGKLQKALEHVRNVRHHAVIQFHPNIEEGRKKLYSV